MEDLAFVPGLHVSRYLSSPRALPPHPLSFFTALVIILLFYFTPSLAPGGLQVASVCSPLLIQG